MDDLIAVLEARRAAHEADPSPTNATALRAAAAAVLQAARSPRVPVDVDDATELFRQGYTIPQLETAAPILDGGQLRTYEGEWNAEVEKAAARARRAVGIALSVLKAVA